MKTAAERYDEAAPLNGLTGSRPILLREGVIQIIEEAVAEERARWREWLDRMQKAQELEIEEDFDPAPDKRERTPYPKPC